MQGNGSASLFAGVFGGGLHDEVSGVVVSDRFERVGGFRRRVFGVGVVHIDAAAVGGDHVGDVELRGVGEHVRAGGGAFETGAARVVDRVLLPVVPADGFAVAVRGAIHHVEGQLHRIVAVRGVQGYRVFGFGAHHSFNGHVVLLELELFGGADAADRVHAVDARPLFGVHVGHGIAGSRGIRLPRRQRAAAR